eukprot:6127963-Pyramimonas_sp.AAC.1
MPSWSSSSVSRASGRSWRDSRLSHMDCRAMMPKAFPKSVRMTSSIGGGSVARPRARTRWAC